MNMKYEYENVLTLTKSLATLYLNGSIESSNGKVRTCLLNGLDETLMLQDQIYQTMKEDGMYQVENIKESEILKTYNKLKKDENLD